MTLTAMPVPLSALGWSLRLVLPRGASAAGSPDPEHAQETITRTTNKASQLHIVRRISLLAYIRRLPTVDHPSCENPRMLSFTPPQIDLNVERRLSAKWIGRPDSIRARRRY